MRPSSPSPNEILEPPLDARTFYRKIVEFKIKSYDISITHAQGLTSEIFNTTYF
jgi:hypothetical protein